MYEKLIVQHSTIFEKLADHFQCSPQDIVINKQFSEGKSGDLVLLICVQKAAACCDCGNYVLKIFSAESVSEEIERTHMANEHTSGPCIFIHRTMVYEEETQKFSVLLTWLYTRERCTTLMMHLAKTIPWNPHYRNHLARLYLYPVTPEQQIYPKPEIALQYANEAIQCAKEQDNEGLSIHYHVLGKAYTKQCISTLREVLTTSSLAKALAAAKLSYVNACNAFNKCIAEDKSGYGLTGKLELYSNILNVIKTKCGRNAPLSTILASKENSNPETVKTISSFISEGGDLINQYISQFDTSSAAFRSACVRFYSVIGKLEKLEMFFSANALTQKEKCVRNRAIATVLMESGFLVDKSL